MNVIDLLKSKDKVKEILEKALQLKNKKLAEFLIPLAQDPYLTYRYAKEIVRGKVKDEWEDIIAQDPHSSFNYSLYVLKGPFIKGEDAISKNAELSYVYARLLRNRFIKGEKIIIKVNTGFVNDYLRFLREIGKLEEFLKDHPEVNNIFNR
jgi:hypothetical protein